MLILTLNQLFPYWNWNKDITLTYASIEVALVDVPFIVFFVFSFWKI